MKRIFSTILISLILTVALALPVLAVDVSYPLQIVNFDGNPFDISDVPNSSIPSTAVTTNVINLVDYAEGYDYYVWRTIIGGDIGQFEPAQMRAIYNGAGLLTDVSSADYVNYIEFEAVVACPSVYDLNEFCDNIMLHWLRSDAESEGDLTSLIPAFQRVTEVVASFPKSFNFTDTNGTYQYVNFTVHVIHVSFILEQPIELASVDDLKYSFYVDVPFVSPWYGRGLNASLNTYSYQCAFNELKLSYATLDDIVANIGSQLSQVNNNLVILQDLDKEILDALLESPYSAEVQEYLDNVEDTKNTVESIGQAERELWEDISFPEFNNDTLSLWSSIDFLWNDWVITIVISLTALAMASYAIFGGGSS